jgi:hypothetical protein
MLEYFSLKNMNEAFDDKLPIEEFEPPQEERLFHRDLGDDERGQLRETIRDILESKE